MLYIIIHTKINFSSNVTISVIILILVKLKIRESAHLQVTCKLDGSK